MTQHATERKLRLAAAGMDAALVSRLAKHLDNMAPHFRCDTAVHVYTLARQGWAEEQTAAGMRISNGDMVVGIIRDGVVVTVMLRRSNQPWTPQALRVENTYQAIIPEGK